MESNDTAPMSDEDSMATEGIETGPKSSFLTSNGTREGAENRMGASRSSDIGREATPWRWPSYVNKGDLVGERGKTLRRSPTPPPSSPIGFSLPIATILIYYIN